MHFFTGANWRSIDEKFFGRWIFNSREILPKLGEIVGGVGVVPHSIELFHESEIPVTRFTFVFVQNEKSTFLPNGWRFVSSLLTKCRDLYALSTSTIQMGIGPHNFYPKGDKFLGGIFGAPSRPNLGNEGHHVTAVVLRIGRGILKKVSSIVALTVLG